jgi:hypothetical protein
MFSYIQLVIVPYLIFKILKNNIYIFESLY